MPWKATEVGREGWRVGGREGVRAGYRGQARASSVGAAIGAGFWKVEAPAAPVLLEPGLCLTARSERQVGGFALVAPFAIPLLPVDRFVAYQAKLGMRPSSGERHDTGPLPQFFADRFGWRELTSQVASIVAALPPGERDSCLIVTRNYGQAGAINYHGRARGLPSAVCQHNSYYLWGRGSDVSKVYVIVGQTRADLEGAFGEVEEAGRTHAAWAMAYENHVPIWICRDIRLPLDEAWRRGRIYI